MTREIKFRAWDGRQMTTSGIFFNATTGRLEVPTQYALNNESIPDDRQMKLMQFTGLRDKNGVEIYEGDIVREQFDFAEGSSVHFSPIGWCHYTASFAVSSEDEMYADSAKENMEVVGNIYQNPELLEDNE